jgi:flagellar motor switch/type III secretory pathway protein FliN
MPEAVPYLLLGDSRRQRLQDRLGDLVDGWYKTWSPEMAAEPLAELIASGTSRELAARGDSWVFAATRGEETLLQATVPADFLRVLSGVSSSAGVFTHTMDASQAGFTALLTERVVAALCNDIAHSALPAAQCSIRRIGHAGDPLAERRGSGAQTLLVSIATDKPRPALELLLTSVVIDALLGDRPTITQREPMTGRRKASSEQHVKVSAVLGSATVSWPDLLALCVGDVIVLDQSLSAPCTLQVGGSTPIADAQLGHMDHALAAQVTRIRTSS